MKPPFNEQVHRKRAKHLGIPALEYTVKDCFQAIMSNPTSENTPYYRQELNVYLDELINRASGGQRPEENK